MKPPHDPLKKLVGHPVSALDTPTLVITGEHDQRVLIQAKFFERLHDPTNFRIGVGDHAVIGLASIAYSLGRDVVLPLGMAGMIH